MSDFPTRHPYSLGIWQNQIERIMAAWIAELPVRIYYGCEVTGFAQDDTGVEVELADGQSLRAQYLLGCDGGRSVIRKAAGIEFPGWDATRSNLIAEVEVTEAPPRGVPTTRRASMVSKGWRTGGHSGSSSPNSSSARAARQPCRT